MMKKKVAIITGSSGSIGNAITKEFITQGYNVYGIDRHPPDHLEQLNYTHLDIDLSDIHHITQKLDSTLSLGEHNILINCAGIREIIPLRELNLSTWINVLNVNLTAAFLCSQHIAENAITQTATLNIVNICSVSGELGEPNRTAYVSSKHALLGLTKQLSIEYGKYGFRCNAISPGVTRTQMTEHYFRNHEQLEKIKSGLYLNKIGTPGDIAKMAMYLDSDYAAFITGSNFTIDGGWTAGKNI